MRHVQNEVRAGGYPVNVPAAMAEDKVDIYAKRFIEVADYSLQDVSGLTSMFRGFHGGDWTMKVLAAAVDELANEGMDLSIRSKREELLPVFIRLIELHKAASDADFGYPRKDRSRLPL